MRQALDDLIARNPGVRPEKLVSAHIEGDNGEGVRGSAAFLELAQDRDIVELVSGVLGEDVILWGCHVFCKPAAEGYETPWHQDGHYWPIRPLATCTVWVALEPSTRSNGCLRVIPRPHRDKVLHPHLHEDRADVTLNQRMTDGTDSLRASSSQPDGLPPADSICRASLSPIGRDDLIWLHMLGEICSVAAKDCSSPLGDVPADSAFSA